MNAAARPPRSSTSVELPADLRSPALARRYVTTALHGGPHQPLLDDALLLVTEIVTNAIVHAGTSARLSIDTTDHGSIRFEVVDRSPMSSLAMRSSSANSTGGRGLHRLSALASAWGTMHTPSEKSVWFTLGPSPARDESTTPSVPADTVTVWPSLAARASEIELLRWLLMLDTAPPVDVGPTVLLSEAVHRLCDALDVESAVLVECRADRPGDHPVLLERGLPIPKAVLAAEIARAEDERTASAAPAEQVRSFPVAVFGDLLAVLVIDRDTALSEVDTIAVELTCWCLATILSEERLQATARRARGNATLVAEASELFAGTLDADLALNLATQLVVPRFGSWAAVWSMNDHGPALTAVTHHHENDVLPLREALSSVESASFVRRVVNALAGKRSALIAPADLPHRLQNIGTGEVVAVALTARRRLLAVMLVAASPATDERPASAAKAVFDADSVAMLVDVATRAAVGVDAALLFTEQRDVATALQASLLPPDLPFTPNLEFGARYVAAGEMSTVGGDFYDVFALDNGDWVVLVGDVCGRGPEAAAITGLARSVLRVCLRDGHSGAEAYARLNREILELGPRNRFCTSALAILRPGPVHTSASITVAGHPLPVLARADGRVETVGVPGTLIGVEPQLSLHQSEVLLSPGDAVVLYTDGVTERRRGSLMLDEEGLIAAVTAAIGESADNLAAAVEQTVKDFSPETSRDDLAILVVRRPMTPAPTEAAALSTALTP